MLNPSILTLEEAAAYLRVSPEELQEELEAGRLPGTRIAGQWRLGRAALEKFLAELPTRDADAVVSSTTPAPAESATETADTRPAKELLAPRPEAPREHAEATSTHYAAEENGNGSLAPDPNRSRARIWRYNLSQAAGSARLPDGRLVEFTQQHFLDSSVRPMPGDTIEFDLQTTWQGDLEARGIRLIPAAGREVTMAPTATRVPLAIPPPTPKPNAGTAPVRPAAPPTRPTGQAQELYLRAAVARAEGRYDDARNLFRKALQHGPAIDIYTAFIRMEIERSAHGSARQLLEQAMRQFPKQWTFYDQAGQLERRARSFERAEALFRRGLEHCPGHPSLLNGLAQSLMQLGTEQHLKDAGEIYDKLERQKKLNRGDAYYQRYAALHDNPRANLAFGFFLTAGMKVGTAGRRALPNHIVDIAVEITDEEFNDAFGVSGAFLVRCFRKQPSSQEINQLSRYLRDMGPRFELGLHNKNVLVNPILAFLAVPHVDAVRDQIMTILGDSREAIIPLDDSTLLDKTDPRATLKDVLGRYLGHRNLYDSTVPVSGRRFFGREKLLVQLADEIRQGHSLGIYGLRKMGKTSLVYQLRDEKLHGNAVAYLDLQASAALQLGHCEPIYWEMERDLYQRLIGVNEDAAGMFRLARYERYTDLANAEVPAAIHFAEDIRAFLDRLAADQLPGIHRLVIVMDELERILPVAGQQGVAGYLELFSLLRGLAQTERYRGLLCSVVVAANAAISERGYWDGRENPVFALYKPVFLSPLSEQECMEMIRALGKGMSVYWEDDAIRAVFNETAGHPFLTRLFCSWISRQYPTRPLRNVTVQMVEEQIGPLIRHEGDKFEQIIELLHTNFPDEAAILERIALDEVAPDLPDESYRHLEDYSLVATHEGGMRIRLNLLRRWLRRRAGHRE